MEKKLVSDEIVKRVKELMDEYGEDLDITLNTMLEEGEIEEPFRREEKIYIASVLGVETEATNTFESADEYEERNGIHRYKDYENSIDDDGIGSL